MDDINRRAVVTGIPETRLIGYHRMLEQQHDVATLTASIEQMTADLDALRAAKRSRAVQGATDILSSTARVLCRTVSKSAEEGRLKIDTLISLTMVFREDPLMMAIIQEAAVCERESWFPH